MTITGPSKLFAKPLLRLWFLGVAGHEDCPSALIRLAKIGQRVRSAALGG